MRKLAESKYYKSLQFYEIWLRCQDRNFREISGTEIALKCSIGYGLHFGAINSYFYNTRYTLIISSISSNHQIWLRRTNIVSIFQNISWNSTSKIQLNLNIKQVASATWTSLFFFLPSSSVRRNACISI